MCENFEPNRTQKENTRQQKGGEEGRWANTAVAHAKLISDVFPAEFEASNIQSLSALVSAEYLKQFNSILCQLLLELGTNLNGNFI